MTIRNLTILTLVIVSATSTGCSGMKNFMFGRGSRCGLCCRAGQIGQALNPFRPCGEQPGTPMCGAVPFAAAPTYGPSYSGECQCQDNYAVGMAGDCQCATGGVYSGNVSDPYLGGEIVGSSMPYGENVVPGTMAYGNGGYPSDVNVIPPPMIQGDRFQARRLDSRGDVIIQADPLPPGARYID